jgi:hypothetical protein
VLARVELRGCAGERGLGRGAHEASGAAGRYAGAGHATPWPTEAAPRTPQPRAGWATPGTARHAGRHGRARGERGGRG